MANTRVPQNFQIRKSSTYTDTTTPTEANFETNPVYLEDDMNNLRSVVLNRSGGSNWWDDFNDGSVNRRKIATLGTDLDVVETKDFLFNRLVLVDIAATTVLQVLTFPTNTPGLGTVPAAVTSGTEGAVATGSANFAATRTSGTAVLAADLFSTGEPNALRPLNLGSVADGSTGDPVVTTNGNQMKCLLITERATDGAFGNTASTDRGAIVFIEINATNDGYIYATASDLPASINYTYTERSEFLNLNEWAFLNEPAADAVAGTDVTLTLARTNQSGPVLPNNKDIDWQIGDGNDFRFEDDGNATIASFAVDGGGVRRVTLGTAAGTDVLTFEGATFDVNVSNDATFAAGIIVEDGGNQIRVGQTSNTIDNSAGALSITGAAGLTETATTGNFTMTATTGSMDLQAATAVTIDSSGGAINIGGDADTGAINIGTSATARTITVGSSSSTAVDFDSGTGAFSFDSTTADTGALMDLATSGLGGTSVGLFVGTSDPNTRVTAAAGSLFVDSTAALWQNTDGTNTGWVAFGSASGNSLQQAYVQGETIAVSDAEGTLAISNTDADTGDMMTITNTQTGATDQNALVITMTDANSTGEALTIVNGGIGDALNVQDGAANTVFQVDGAGAVTATPTSGQNFTATVAGAGFVDINTGAGGVDIDATGGAVTIDSTSYTLTTGSTSIATDTSGVITTYPTENAFVTTNLDPTANTTVGITEIISSNFNLANDTFGDAYMRFGAGTQGYQSTTATTSGEVHVVSVDAVATGTSTTFTAGVGPATNAPSITLGGGEGANFTVGNFILVTGAAERENNGIFRIISIAVDTLTLYGVGGTAVTEEWLSSQVTGGADAGATVAEVTLTVFRQNAGVLEFAENVTGGTVTYTGLTSGAVTLTSAVSTYGGTTATGDNDFTWVLDGTTSTFIDWDLTPSAAGTRFGITDGTNDLFVVTGDTGGDTASFDNLLTFNVDTTGAITVDSSAAGISLDAAAASNFNTTVGNLTLRSDAGNLNGLGLAINLTGISATAADDITLTAATSTGGGNAGGDVFINSGVGDTTGAGGVIDINGGTGGATDGTGGAINVDAGGGGGTNGSGGALTANAGVAVGAGNGGNLSVNAGDAVTSGSGGTATFTSGSGGTTGSGGDLTIQSGDGGSTSGPVGRLLVQGGDSVNLPGGAVDISAGASSSSTGGHVTVTAGDSTTGNGGQVRIDAGTGSAGNGYVRLRNALNAAVTETSIIATFENQGTGTGGGANVSFYTEDPTTGSGAVPSHSADSGSLYWQQRTGLAPRLFMNTSTGTSGTTWSQVDVGGVSGSLEAAWAAATGAGTTLGASGFTGNITDGDTYLIQTLTGSNNLLTLAAEVAGNDQIILGNTDSDTLTQVRGGTGGVGLSTGDGAAIGGEIDLTAGNGTTTGGAIDINAGVGVTNGAGGAVSIDAGDGAGAGAGGAITIEGGAGGATGNGGAITIEGGATTAGSEGDISIGTVTAGDVRIGIDGSGTTKADSLSMGSESSFSVLASDGAISITGSDVADASGNDISLNAGASSTAATDGASIRLLPGDGGTTGVHGSVDIDGAFDNDEAFLTLTGSGGSGDSDVYAGATAPTHTASGGSVFLYNDGATADTGGALYVQLDGGTGANWEQVVTADPTAGARQFVQGVINRTITGSGTQAGGPTGTNIREGDFTPAITLPVRDSGLSFDTQAEVYFNGVLMFNGTGNDVNPGTVAGTGNDTTKDIWLQAGTQLISGDIVSITYFNI